MIVGYHIIFGAFGFWLPNDPRGSWSAFDDNPVKEGKKPQYWSFVTPYAG